MELNAQRIANGRLAIERAGGVGSVAKKMGYSNPSFLVQIFGPNPLRKASEKTVRKMEKALGLRDGVLDQGASSPLPVAQNTGPIDAVQLRNVIALVSRLAQEEAVSLSADKFASLVAMSYEDQAEHAGQMRESRMRQVVQMLKA